MRLAATALALTAALALAGCGGRADAPSTTPAAPTTAGGTPSGSPSGSASADASPSTPAGTTIDVTVTGSDVQPNGERVKVPVGQPVTLRVTADAPGEVHVHSTPEQEFEYQKGVTELTLTNLDQPGIVEVESHTLDKLILQLQVS
ncbi:hypothetical protein K8Z61_11220 [Nocardioides sp. TRM66260-LWL]|uniref:hypothetical protein n=1 Tax=Nocardioides sp. TRM66260-LWL TaxID=2874478 RepID=UPI001CC58BAE|nr:hypothetical protein [Nocardioides sp. TRM66260-LWL]MBZ5735069.1 hypothetical protein [Nocardioides sp. TRM66260-LWL]